MTDIEHTITRNTRDTYNFGVESAAKMCEIHSEPAMAAIIRTLKVDLETGAIINEHPRPTLVSPSTKT